MACLVRGGGGRGGEVGGGQAVDGPDVGMDMME